MLLKAIHSIQISAQSSEAVAVFTSPLFWGLMALAMILQQLKPVDAKQRVLSFAVVEDAFYFALIVLFRVLVLSFYIRLLGYLYHSYLGIFTVSSAASWPSWVRAVVAIALSDFLGWFHHLVRHKVPLFWQFHTIHHSQRELNVFTDFRYHPLEYVVSETILFIPMFAFQAAFPTTLAWALFQQWYTKFCHASIRTDLGPLRFVLVTPQSHRIHHSTLTEHHDSNYGVVFSIWDRLFGTQHEDASSYPPIGLDDPAFPITTGSDMWRPLRALWAQLAYPFKAVRGQAGAQIQGQSEVRTGVAQSSG